jgi:TRAP-type C4-dicarboxylate transport system permease small subunit
VNGTARKIADGVAMAANAAGTVVVILLIALVNYDIVARGVFGKPFMGAVEMVQFAMVFIVFLQLPDVIRVGRLTRSDGALNLLRSRRPAAGRVVAALIDALGAIYMIIVAIAIWPEFVDMWQSNDFFGVPGVFTAPWWPVKLVIFFSACLCAIHFMIHVFRKSGDNAPHSEGRS